MNTGISRRAFLAMLGSGVGCGIAGQAQSDAPVRSLRPVLRGPGGQKALARGAEDIVASAKLGGKVSFAVSDATNGRALESRNGAVATPPASVTKAVTALYALSALGAKHRFSTDVVVTGGVANGVVAGDLVLVGGADPTLDSTDLAELAAQLKAQGIREVKGRFLVYDAALPRLDRIDPAQPDHVGYNPGISGLALNFNRVHFEWRRGSNGYQVTMDARTVKYRPDVSVSRMKIVARNAPVYTYKSLPRRDEWTVARGALGKGGARWLPVRLPGLYAADVFATMARANGIVLKKAEIVGSVPNGTRVARLQSAPLEDILQDMLKFSNNLIAEMVGLAATSARVGKPRSLKASAMEMSRWAASNLGMKRTRLVDHSGLGDASRMTADEMCQALVRVKGTGLRAILKPIKMLDEKGRLKKSQTLNVAAKTGTLNFVSALAGYFTARDGREMAFAIFAADIKTRRAITRENREAPKGARSWNRRAKAMHQRLIERWALLYGA